MANILSVAVGFGRSPRQKLPFSAFHLFYFYFRNFQAVLVRTQLAIQLLWQCFFLIFVTLLLILTRRVYHLWHPFVLRCVWGVLVCVFVVLGGRDESRFNYENECKLCTKWIKNVYRLTPFVIFHSNAVYMLVDEWFFAHGVNCVFFHLNFDAHKWLTLNKPSTPHFFCPTTFLVHVASVYIYCCWCICFGFRIFSIYEYEYDMNDGQNE